jgi:hypothetical protein
MDPRYGRFARALKNSQLIRAIRKWNGNAILRVLAKLVNLTDMNDENWCGWLLRPI